MNSPIKFLFLPTIDVIFLLTLPDTHTLLAAHLPPWLFWAINMHRKRSAEHSNHTTAHQQQPLLSGLPPHRAVSQQEQPGKTGRWACWKPEGVGVAGSGHGERLSRERRETGKPCEWSMAAEPRAPQGFPCCCFGLLCPEPHTFLCKCTNLGSSPLRYVITWSTGNGLNIFTLTYPNFK